MLSVLSAPMSRHLHRRPGEDSRPAEQAKAQDKEQGDKRKQREGRWDRHSRKLESHCQGLGCSAEEGGACLWNMGKRSLSRRCGPSGQCSSTGV